MRLSVLSFIWYSALQIKSHLVQDCPFIYFVEDYYIKLFKIVQCTTNGRVCSQLKSINLEKVLGNR